MLVVAAGVPSLSYLFFRYLYTVVDYTDAVPESTLDAMYQYATLRTTSLTECRTKATRIFTPKVALMTYRTALTTGYTTPRRNPWISTTDSDCAHFALKLAFDGQGVATEAALRIMCTMYFQCKAVK